MHDSLHNTLIEAEQQPGDLQGESSLRPDMLADFTGQAQACKNLKIFIDAARARGESLDHVLFYGPPGLGKTTLSQIISREMGVGFHTTSGPILTKPGDLAALLTNLQAGDVLFIDEIHRLNAAVEEVLYPAMEDYKLDIMIGQGPAARSVRIDLPKFTLVGATTRLGLLANPLRDRFGIPLKLQFYSVDELKTVITRGARILNVPIEDEGAEEIAKRARGTPRIAVRLLKRVRDFTHAHGTDSITRALADLALSALDVDHQGLDAADRRYMNIMAEFYGGGPVGVETLAAALAEERDSLEETIEPYLLQIGYIQRTPRGRMLTAPGYHHIGLTPPAAPSVPQLSLLEDSE
ncbi:Holliday junction branch migration DNA helicase RuvB [bacterium]|nr:Holliday junction branch migration DNA helicase RuvB [bacterium]